jgi:hypothetical protein
MQTNSLEQLSPADADAILERLPERIRVALTDRAMENRPLARIRT